LLMSAESPVNGTIRPMRMVWLGAFAFADMESAARASAARTEARFDGNTPE